MNFTRVRPRFKLISDQCLLWEGCEVQFTTKKDYAYEQIKNDILSGKLLPGDKLVIRDLAKQYDMSYIPIREAISQLFHEGLVHSIPYTGTRVAEVDIEKIFEFTALRYEIEDLCLRTAVPHITPEDITALYEIFEELQALYRAGDLKRYMIVNRSFYTYFYDRSPYSHIRDQIDELYKISRTNTSLVAPAYIPKSLEQHRELIRLAGQGDVDGAVLCHHTQKRAALRAVFDVMRDVVLHPQQLEGHPVSIFYRRKAIENDQTALLQQLDRLEELFSSF